MTENDIAAFRSLFTTITLLSEETGLYRNSLSRGLKMAGLMPFTRSGRNFGGIYLRQDVARVVSEIILNQQLADIEALYFGDSREAS